MAQTVTSMLPVLYAAFIDDYADEYARVLGRPAEEFKAAIDTPEKLMRFVERLHGDGEDV